MLEISKEAINIFWAAAIVVFAVLEAATAQLVSIWFVIGAIAALIASLLGAGIAVELVVFIAVTILALVITRPLVRKYIHPKAQRTNADKAVGQVGIVIEDINNIDAKGQVKVDGQIWTARSADGSLISVGSEIIIDKIEGVKLIVKAK